MTAPAKCPVTPGVLQQLTARGRPDQEYYLYVPPGFVAGAGCRLLVTMHGHDREAMGRIEHFAEFADQQNFIVLAPHFPPSIRFQLLGVGSDRADLRLLDLVDEVAEEFALDGSQFDLFGYSGGAQFSHRFLYVWPNRLRSVVVGAPGTVTLPDERERWPVGVRNLAKVAGARFDLDAVRQPRIMLLVGTEDLILEGFNQHPWAMRTGATRLGRARTLHAAWLRAGIEHEYAEIEGSAHGVDPMIVERVSRFLCSQTDS